MIFNFSNNCAYCGSPIEPGQRWVREKVYDASLAGQNPRYHRYHVELSAGEELSCWEKHQVERETARIIASKAA